jgi:hypothetical protein
MNGRFLTLLFCGCMPTLLAQDLSKKNSYSFDGTRGWITDKRLSETSGLAISRLHAGHVWVLNDSGETSDLFALNTASRVVTTLHLRDIKNVDWEELASANLAGTNTLIVADIGDNGGVRSDHVLYGVQEPETLTKEEDANVLWRIHFRYPDGSHDAECFTVDSKKKIGLLVSKRVNPPIMYSVDLGQPELSNVRTAARIGALENIPQPTIEQTKKPGNYARFASQPTGCVLSRDANTFYLLTYAAIYVYRKSSTQEWTQALAGQTPTSILLPPMPQAEAITLSRREKYLWVASEQLPTPILQFKKSN